MRENIATFDTLPDEIRVHIASYLDTKNLCFFAAASARCLGNALHELRKHQKELLGQLHIQASMDHSMLYTPQALYVWGNNEAGQLGLGHNDNCSRLTSIGNVPGTIRQVVTGFKHTLVLTDLGLYVCGDNRAGQLGLGHNNNCSRLTKVNNVPGTVRQIAAGGWHTLILTDQGLFACGENRLGQLGLMHNDRCNRLTKVENVSGAIQQIAAGSWHTLVLTDQGLYSCGDNEHGKLGLAHRGKFITQLTKIEHIPGTVRQIAAGLGHTLVLTDQGLYACGNNQCGELGLGHTNSCNQLTKVEYVPGVIRQVVAGHSHTLVLTDQGLYVCGENLCGQLGLGHITTAPTKFEVTMQRRAEAMGLSYAAHTEHDKHNDRLVKVEHTAGTALQAAAGVNHTLVLTDQGLFACGNRTNGQLGLEDQVDKPAAENIHTADANMPFAAATQLNSNARDLTYFPECCLLTEIDNLPRDIKQLLSLYRHINNLKISINPILLSQGH